MKYILTFICILLFTLPAYGRNNGNKNKHQNNNQHEYGSDSDHQSKKKKPKKHKKKGKKGGDLPPGLQKKVDRGGELPPGWQKKIRKGHKVDNDLYRHMRACDRKTLRHLPRLRSGESYREIDNEVVRLKNSSREILEVFKKNALPPLPPPPPFPFF